MADNSNPLGTDIASAQQAIKAMMTPLDEDNVGGGDAQGDEPEADYAEPEAQAEEAYEAEPDVSEDTEDYSDDDLGEQPRTYRVKVNGEEIEVTEDELLNGYSRQQDYTRKSQELAERRKAIEALEQEIEAERYQYAELLPRMRQQLEQQLQAEPDWDSLYEKNPIEATKLERQWRQAKQQREAQIKAVEEEQARLSQIQQRKLQAEMNKHLEAEQARLTQVIPEWKDAEKAKTEAAQIREFLLAEGFSEQDVNSIQSAGLVKMARNAMLYERGKQRITEAKSGRKTEGPKQMKPGSRGTQPRKRSDVEKAQTRLRQTGRVADAANVIKSLL